jgi:phosphatidate cytidylyltransferase
VTRILSGVVMIAVTLGALWYAPSWALLLLIEAVLAAACLEYAGLVQRSGVPVPRVVATLAAVFACAAVAWPGVPAHLILIAVILAALVAVLVAFPPAPHVPATAAATLFPVLYLGLPLGMVVTIRDTWGREALLLVLLVVWVSDTAQFYTGTLLGRHRLAPAISPKKSIEGAVGGFIVGVAIMITLGRLWLPAIGMPLLAAIGAVLVALGIVGDLFESLLKRSANVKDSSGLIPGHGGVLDRIDALLFVVPAFYLVLTLIA